MIYTINIHYTEKQNKAIIIIILKWKWMKDRDGALQISNNLGCPRNLGSFAYTSLISTVCCDDSNSYPSTIS